MLPTAMHTDMPQVTVSIKVITPFSGSKLNVAEFKSHGLQVWRPLTGPVQDSALGFIDAATVKAQDLVAVPVHVAENFTHEVSYVVHNPDHR